MDKSSIFTFYSDQVAESTNKQRNFHLFDVIQNIGSFIQFAFGIKYLSIVVGEYPATEIPTVLELNYL